MILDRTHGLEPLLAEVEGKPHAMVALARLMHSSANAERAVALAARALELAPQDGEVCAIAAEVLSAGVPRWHFEIVRDHPRNDAYEAALRRAVFPGCKVLEIGTGTGLLAMMAARAGAAEVITCEANFAVAMAAKKIIALNGYADRVRVIVKHSTALDVEADMGGPADILVSEIISNDLLSEEVLPAVEHARRHLVKPDAAIIPLRGRIRVALAYDDERLDAMIGHAAGFDLTPFNALASPHDEIYVGASRLTLRSDPVDLFTFDFAAEKTFPGAKCARTLRAHGRRINGIAQWIALDMDGEGVFENPPSPGTTSSWMTVFYPFKRDVSMTENQEVVVHARHDRGGLRIWTEGLLRS